MSDGTGARRGGRPWSRGVVDSDLAFAAAYASTLAGCLVSSGLTYVYVGPGVRELNPIVATLIAWLGPGGMVAARVLVVIGAFWAYHVLRSTSPWPGLVVGFAWIGALVHLADAAHDLRVATTATLAGFVPVADLGACLLVLSASLLAGVVLRPPASPVDLDGAAAGVGPTA